MNYKYYMTQRPPMPGAMPKDGLIDIHEVMPAEYCDAVGHNVYATLTYDRQLSKGEIRAYELTPESYNISLSKREIQVLISGLISYATRSKDDDFLDSLFHKLHDQIK